MINKEQYIIPSLKTKGIFEYFYVVMSLLLLVAAGYTQSTILNILFIVFLLIPIKNPVLLLPVLFAAAVTSRLFLSSFDSQMSLSRIVVTIFILYSILNFILKKQARTNKRILIWLLLTLSIVILSTLQSETLDFIPLFSFALNLIMFYFMSLYILDEQEKKRLNNYMIISAIFIGLAVLYMTFKSNGMVLINQRLSIKEVNSNRLAMAIAQVIMILVFAIVTFIKKMKKLFLFFLATLVSGLFFSMLLTGSRTAFLAVLLSSISIILLTLNGKNKRKLVLGIFILIFISLSIYKFTNGYDFQGVFRRFTLENIEESRGTHRINNSVLIIKYVIPHNFYWGVGIGADNVKVALGSHNPLFKNAAHNIIIDPLSQIGIFGFLALWYMIIFVLKKSNRTFKDGNYLIGLPLSLLLVSLFNGIGETMYTTRFIWFAMGLCLIFLPNNKKDQMKIE